MDSTSSASSPAASPLADASAEPPLSSRTSHSSSGSSGSWNFNSGEDIGGVHTSTPPSTADSSFSTAAATSVLPGIVALDSIRHPIQDHIYFYETPTHVYLLASDRLRVAYDVLTFVKQALHDVHPDSDETVDVAGKASTATEQAHPTRAAMSADADEERAQAWPWCARLQPHPSRLTSTEAQAFVESLRRAHESPTMRLPLRWGRAKALVGAVRFTAGYYLLLVTQRRLVARIGSHRIFEVAKTEMISLLRQPMPEAGMSPSSPSQAASAASFSREETRQKPSATGAQYLASLASAAMPGLFRRTSEEEGYTKQFMDVGFDRHAFYYSHTYDLTNTLQTNMTVPAARRERRLKFVWNEFLHEPFAELWDEEEEAQEVEKDGLASATQHNKNGDGHDEGEESRPDIDPLNRELYDEEEEGDDVSQNGGRPPPYAGLEALPMPPHFHPQTWQLFFTHGAVVQKVVWLQHRSVLLTLIGRVSREYTGARYLRRGVNPDGHVANHVEVEQIVCDESTLVRQHTAGAFSSYVQVRGSIPLHWSHAPSALPKPPIVLSLGVDPHYHHTCLHFQELVADYGVPVICMDLVKQQEKKPREVPLGAAFKSAVGALASSVVGPARTAKRARHDEGNMRGGGADVSWPRASADVLQYHALDLRREADRAWNSVTAAAERASEQVGFFSCVPADVAATEACVVPIQDDQDAGHGRGHRGAQLMRLQHGVVRTNCIDCIDRTNVAQYFISLHALGEQLTSLGLLYAPPDLALSPSVQELLLQMYLFLGDAIATQYGGSAQVGAGVLHRGTGWDQWMGIQRLYHNVLGDREKQAVVNLFLGRFQPCPLFWWRVPRSTTRLVRHGRTQRQPLFVSPLHRSQPQLLQEQHQCHASSAPLDEDQRTSMDRPGDATAVLHPDRTLFPRFVSRALNPEMSLLPSVLLRGAEAVAGADGRGSPPALLPSLLPRSAHALRNANGSFARHATVRGAEDGPGGGETVKAGSPQKLLELAYAENGADYYLHARTAPAWCSGAANVDLVARQNWWKGPLRWHLLHRRCRGWGAARASETSASVVAHAQRHQVCGMARCQSCRALFTPHAAREADDASSDEDDDAEKEGEEQGHETVVQAENSPSRPQNQEVHALVRASASLSPPHGTPPRPALPQEDALRHRTEAHRIELATHERQLCIEPPLPDLGERVLSGGGNKATFREVMDDGFQLELGTAVIATQTLTDDDAAAKRQSRSSARALIASVWSTSASNTVTQTGLDVVELVGTTRHTSPCTRYACREESAVVSMRDSRPRPRVWVNALPCQGAVWAGCRYPSSDYDADPAASRWPRYCPQFSSLPREVRGSIYFRESATRVLWRPSFGVPLDTNSDPEGDPMAPAATTAGDGASSLTGIDVPRAALHAAAAQADSQGAIVLLAHTLAAQYGATPEHWTVAHVRGAMAWCLEMSLAPPLAQVPWQRFGAEARDGKWLAQLAARYEARCDRGYWSTFFEALSQADHPSTPLQPLPDYRSRSPSRSSLARAELHDGARQLSISFAQRWFAEALSEGNESGLMTREQHDALQLLLRATQYLSHIADGTAAASASIASGKPTPVPQPSPQPHLFRARHATHLAMTLTRLLHLPDGLVRADTVDSVIRGMIACMRCRRAGVPERPRMRFSDEPVSGTDLHERVQQSFILPPSFLRCQLVAWWTQPHVLASGVRTQLAHDAASRLVEWLLAVHLVLPLFALSAVTDVATTGSRESCGADAVDAPPSSVYLNDPTALLCFADSLSPSVLNAAAGDSTRVGSRPHHGPSRVAPREQVRDAVSVQAAALSESLASVAVSVAQTLQHALADHSRQHHRSAARQGSPAGTGAAGRATKESMSASPTLPQGPSSDAQVMELMDSLDARLSELATGLRQVDLTLALQELDDAATCEAENTTREMAAAATTTATAASTATKSRRFRTLPHALTPRDRFLMCFFLNVFNALYIHAWLRTVREQHSHQQQQQQQQPLRTAEETAQWGAPGVPSIASRISVAFYEVYAYQIGPRDVFSLSDIKFGILQGNVARPYGCLPPFASNGATVDGRERYVPLCLQARAQAAEDEIASVLHDRITPLPVQQVSVSLQGGRYEGGGFAGNGLCADTHSEDETSAWSRAFLSHAQQHAQTVDLAASHSQSQARRCAALLRQGWQLQQRDARFLAQRLALCTLDTHVFVSHMESSAFQLASPWSVYVQEATTISPSPSSPVSCTSPTTATVARSPALRQAGPAAALRYSFSNVLGGVPTRSFFSDASAPSEQVFDGTVSPSSVPLPSTAAGASGVDVWALLLHRRDAFPAAFTTGDAASWHTALSTVPVLFVASTLEAELRQVEQATLRYMNATYYNNAHRTAQGKPAPALSSAAAASQLGLGGGQMEDVRPALLRRLVAAHPQCFPPVDEDKATSPQTALFWLQRGQQGSRALACWEDDMRVLHSTF